MMLTIREILDSLSETQRRQLMYAFEHNISQHVVYKPGHYVGVNVSPLHILKPNTVVNNWSEGTIDV